MTASEARALVKESVVYKELSLYNDIDNKIRKEATAGRLTCTFSIQNPKKDQKEALSVFVLPICIKEEGTVTVGGY